MPNTPFLPPIQSLIGYGWSAGTAYNKFLKTENESHFDELTQTSKTNKWWYKQDVMNKVLIESDISSLYTIFSDIDVVFNN